MTWIRTIPYDKAGPKLRKAYEAQRELYPAEYALHVAQRRGRRARLVEHRFSVRVTEARMPGIDRDLLARNEETLALEDQRIEAAALIDAADEVFAGLEAEHRTREEMAVFDVLRQQDRAAGGRRRELIREDLLEVWRRTRRAHPQAGMTLGVERFRCRQAASSDGLQAVFDDLADEIAMPRQSGA